VWVVVNTHFVGEAKREVEFGGRWQGIFEIGEVGCQQSKAEHTTRNHTLENGCADAN